MTCLSPRRVDERAEVILKRRSFPKAEGLKALARSIEADIRAFERRCRAELRVVINLKGLAHRKGKGLHLAYHHARAKFEQLTMHDTAQHTGLLIYVLPRERLFSVVGDDGIDGHLLKEGWTVVARLLGENFRKGRFKEGFSEAIAHLAATLREHYPTPPGDSNELPNVVIIED